MERCIAVGIVDDEEQLEGEETFQFFFVSVPDGVTVVDPDEAVVTIVDDDGKKYYELEVKLFNHFLFSFSVIGVSFSTPAVRVDENDPNGSTQVCVIADTAVARSFTVEVGMRPSGDNPATGKNRTS